MKCPQCRTPMESRRENSRWDASGLANVVLVDVEVRHCPAWYERAVVIPRIEALHRALATTLIGLPGRLGPREIRFLRKWLGWSGQDFAKHFGVTPTTVSRWEMNASTRRASRAARRLARSSRRTSSLARGLRTRPSRRCSTARWSSIRIRPVGSTYSGAKALDLMSSLYFDIVFADIATPELDAVRSSPASGSRAAA